MKLWYIFLCVILSSCITMRNVSEEYDLAVIDTQFIEEDGHLVKCYVLGDLPFSIKVKKLVRKGGTVVFKAIVYDDEHCCGVPYPTLYQVSAVESKYKVEKVLSAGNIDGIIECTIKCDTPKDAIVLAIDSPGYHGAVYTLRPKV